MKIKKVVNDKPLWDSFIEILNEKIEVSQRKLEQEVNIENVYRAQGEIRMLRSMLRLREDING